MVIKIGLFMNEHLNTSELEKHNDTDYIPSWKTKRVCTSRLKALHTA